MKITPQIAECVGLWLAEGNNKCDNEITFTNNCQNLIKYFNNTLTKIFTGANIRLYIYSQDGKYSTNIICAKTVRVYQDKRANKPYFIWRLASVDLIKIWKDIVQKALIAPNLGTFILRGFFAGEGSVKTGTHSNRVLRIAQKERKYWLEKILDKAMISYRYIPKMRTYEIYNKSNWDKFAKLNITSLHKEKDTKFWKTYAEFKEEHYKKNYIRDETLCILTQPFCSAELAQRFNRSQARIADILVELKKNNLVTNFRIESVDFWIRKDTNKILISRRKQRYLDAIKNPKRTSDVAKFCGVCSHAAFKRLTELQELGLAKRNINKLWVQKEANKEKGII